MNGQVQEESLAKSQRGRVFRRLDYGWLIGEERYQDWVGFEHIHGLLLHPGTQLHVYDLMPRPIFENSRKAVQKSIARAVDALIDTQPAIGLHLQRHVKTGEFCVYTGDWAWR